MFRNEITNMKSNSNRSSLVRQLHFVSRLVRNTLLHANIRACKISLSITSQTLLLLVIYTTHSHSVINGILTAIHQNYWIPGASYIDKLSNPLTKCVACRKVIVLPTTRSTTLVTARTQISWPFQNILSNILKINL